jgi:hypothetical protein
MQEADWLPTPDCGTLRLGRSRYLLASHPNNANIISAHKPPSARSR